MSEDKSKTAQVEKETKGEEVVEKVAETPEPVDKKKSKAAAAATLVIEETPGRRSTRASSRGEVYTPLPKKGKAASSGSGRRGRPKKAAEDETPAKKQKTEVNGDAEAEENGEPEEEESKETAVAE